MVDVEGDVTSATDAQLWRFLSHSPPAECTEATYWLGISFAKTHGEVGRGSDLQTRVSRAKASEEILFELSAYETP